MKFRHVVILTLLILMLDQWIKIYVKTHFYFGEEKIPFPALPWFRFHFIENEGMAYGWKLAGSWGKIALTSFRLIAVIFGIYYIWSGIKKNYPSGYIFCVTLIFAGAIGNLIDSLFYGMAFEFSDVYVQNLAKGFWQEGFKGGYETIMHGRVVDMFYLPIIHDVALPSWFPIWGGTPFEFFRPVFNLSDASITLGLLCILIFQSKFFNNQPAATEFPQDQHQTH